MSGEQLRQSFANLRRALDRLQETRQEDPSANPFLVDAAIQRFEFSFELYWKALKRLLAYEGIEANSPRSTLKHAFAQGWLGVEHLWLDMLDDRNRTSHVYDEQVARQIFERISNYLPEMLDCLRRLEVRYATLVTE